jgi:L-fucose mutarotase/ribose pyranase (RbsD/FucU family)
MMKIRYVPALLLFALTPFAAERTAPPAAASSSAWNRTLLDRIPLYGHRNWIVIADSAYPAQSRTGIETIVSNSDHVQVLQQVLAAVSASRHVRPIVYTDQELKFVDDKDAPGISAYRRQLATLLQNRTVNSLPHEQIIAKLDQVSQTFRVLIIKTNFTLPYTSVFLQLDCAYWGPDAERRLRAAMAKQHQP